MTLDENLTVTGTLDVTGLSTMDNTSITSLNVTGNSNLTGTLDVTGNSTFSTLSSSGLAEFDTLNVDNGATIDSGGFTVTAWWCCYNW